METKKNAFVNLEKKRNLFLLTGLSTSLLISFILINLKFQTLAAFELGFAPVTGIEEEIIPITIYSEPPPPPPVKPMAPIAIKLSPDYMEVPDFEMGDMEEELEDFIFVEEFVEEKESQIPYSLAEQRPVFPNGGLPAMYKFIKNNINPLQEDLGLEGKVYVNFVIGKRGKVKNVEILRGAHPLLDNEVLRVIKMMPRWKPGKQQGKAIEVLFTLPIDFTVDG